MKINVITASWLLAATFTVASALLIFERGGLLAWTGLVVAVVLLLKGLLRPGKLDGLSIFICAALWAGAWFGTRQYVISTWESGEVVELSIVTPNGIHVARTWVLDTDSSMLIYYDAEPDIVSALNSGSPIDVKRDGISRRLRPSIVSADAMQPDELAHLFDLMSQKYGDLNAATGVYYRWLGRSRDRLAVVLRFDIWNPRLTH